MKYCIYCGRKIRKESAICPNCASVARDWHATHGSQYVVEEATRPPFELLRTDRSALEFFGLSVLTLGIYGIVEMVHISREINLIASPYDGRKTMDYTLVLFILSWATLGIGMLLWYHRFSDRLGEELHRRRINYEMTHVHFWKWGFFGALLLIGPFLYYYRLLRCMNLLATDYNSFGNVQ